MNSIILINGIWSSQWRIQEFENGGAQLKAGGLGAALRPPVGPGGEAPGSSWNLDILKGKIMLSGGPIFTYFPVILVTRNVTKMLWDI